MDLLPFETDGIQDFMTKLKTSVQCQTEFGIDIENGAHIIVPHVERLMPKEILQKWREEIHEDDSFSTQKLLDFLQEKLQCYGTATPQKAETKHKGVQPKTTMMLSTASKEIACFCCNKNHKIILCDKFKKMAPKEGPT